MSAANNDGRHGATEKQIITISYYALDAPKLDVPASLQDLIEVRFIDLMEKDFLFLDHGGFRIFRTYKSEHHGSIEEWSEYFLATDIWMDWESDGCFDSRELPAIPDESFTAYQTLYPDSELKQRLPYAIDVGSITEDGLKDPEEQTELRAVQEGQSRASANS